MRCSRSSKPACSHQRRQHEQSRLEYSGEKSFELRFWFQVNRMHGYVYADFGSINILLLVITFY
jgi:hypothetical protein